jgi:hypothetical protein
MKLIWGMPGKATEDLALYFGPTPTLKSVELISELTNKFN